MIIQLTGMLLLQVEHLSSSKRTFAQEVLSIPAFAKYFFMYPVTITFIAKPSPRVRQKFLHNLKVACNKK
jgi:hypothetical protein